MFKSKHYMVKHSPLSNARRDQENFNNDIKQHAFNGALIATIGAGAGIAAYALSKDKSFINPSEVAIDPDMHYFNGMIDINRNFVNALIFSSGVFVAAASFAFALGNSIYQTYRNYVYIEQAGKHLVDFIKDTELANFWIEMNQTNLKLVATNDLIEYGRTQCVKKITSSTIIDGASGTVYLAASIFSLGLAVPVFFPVTTLLTLVAVGAGAIGTAIATYLNRKSINNKLDKVTEDFRFRAQVRHKARTLNHKIRNTQFLKYNKMIDEQTTENTIRTTHAAVFASTLLIRLTELAKIVATVIETIATTALSALTSVRGLLESAINYSNRQKLLKKLPMVISQATQPWIDQKAYIFFGETPLEKYIMTNAKSLSIHMHFNFNSDTPTNIIAKLAEKNRPLLVQLRKSCTSHLMRKDYFEFAKANPELDSYRDRVKAYLLHRVEKLITSDVMSSARVNGARIAFSLTLGLSLLMPPLAGIFAALGVGIMILSELVGRAYAKSEAAKFKAAADKKIEKATSFSIKDASIETKALNNFIRMIEFGVQKKSLDTLSKIKGSVKKNDSAFKIKRIIENKAKKQDSSLKKKPTFFNRALSKTIKKEDTRIQNFVIQLEERNRRLTR